ncbi:glycosyltransferase [Hydrogenophaga flava]|uniref:glycosyltransferase n=1 Tax=Hydrogenophaga flava TaxID=65657 RepID=UPI000824A4CD
MQSQRNNMGHTIIRVDVGVFAHNEAGGITRTLQELMRQEVAGLDVRVLVLANGCTDDTAELARTFAQSGTNSPLGARVEVAELAQGGKSRTWNRYVHELSRPDAEVLIFMDADIDIPESDSLLRLVKGLTSNPALHAFNSHPIKDIVYRPENLGLLDKAIAMGSETLNDWKTAICGSLYAMPSARARVLHMPVGLAVEDGFLRAMILTDALTADEDFSRIDGGDVFHVFASERSVLALIKHQTRIVIGSAINNAAFTALRAVPLPQRRAALAAAASQDNWLSEVIRSQLPKWPYGWIPLHYLTKRIGFIARQPKKLLHPRQIFVLVLGFGFDLVVYINAQIKMAKGVGAGHW